MATETSTAQKRSRNGSGGDASLEDISAEMEILRADLRSLTEAMGNYGSARARDARDNVQDRANQAGERIRDGAADLRTDMERYGHQAEDLVRHQPGMALGAAAGLGFLMGLFASRR
ncbi:DUF883 family protein [Roseisalinus antarcticus]|uniref:DUF883 domain-containing protein n=1 Tax=Roseisalinus antarcticus TaxID=254357 RepID=A0A1Y5SJQ1_9RHOB|nr:DUF883 family protein [Roseisalinus antarcticus]SLN39443.1 hypothetical protein ROA7023_01510 [Roseisalinus antarcticus]